MLEFRERDYNEKAEVLKVLGHPVRLCIVRGLINKGACNVTTMYECLEMPQSTISQHLAKLKSTGIITGDRNGVEITYRVENPLVKKIMDNLF